MISFCRRSKFSSRILLVPTALLLLSHGGALAQAPTRSVPAQPLTPQPREYHASGESPLRTVVTLAPGGDLEDLFAARDLTASLQQHGVLVAPDAGTVDVVVRLLRADSAEAQGLLSGAQQDFLPEMRAEGYVLVSKPHEVTVIGATAAGIFYGVQTLKQMVVDDGVAVKLLNGTVRDWPAMRYRGVDDDLSRGPVPTLAFMKHQLDVFAAYKVNVYSPYFENTLAYSGDPLASPPGGALTRTEARELVAYATQRHILVIPEQEAFGHLHHVLINEKYGDLAETPHGHVFAPGQPDSLPLIKSWFSQIADDFPGPFLHVGADETFELGTGRTRADVDRRGLGPVYADFLTKIHTELAPLHRRLLFWGDVAETDPAAIPGLPKDMIAIPWIYWHKDSYDGDILPFKKAGIETWVAPGDANWSVVYPVAHGALDNIQGFVEAGQRLGSTGELTTVWNDDGEGLFNQDWFGVMFSAAAGWQPGKSDIPAYEAAFTRTFYGDADGKVLEAQREIMAAEDRIDVSDGTFWMDPWSSEGVAKGLKMGAKIHEGRLHAERAIELLEVALAQNPHLQETDALRAMELGARRIDFIGLKFQLGDEMAQAYAKAYAQRADSKHETETRELLYSITAMNGRCQDLRDGYSLLKNLYRDSWLAENRPYWIDNVLVRYDLQIQQWQRRGDAIDHLIDRWQEDKTLPTAIEAGIPVAAAPVATPRP